MRMWRAQAMWKAPLPFRYGVIPMHTVPGVVQLNGLFPHITRALSHTPLRADALSLAPSRCNAALCSAVDDCAWRSATGWLSRPTQGNLNVI
jgi:hypothetical protein